MPVATVGVIASFEGHEYLVSRLGQGSQWVRNVRVTDGLAMIRAGERQSVALRVVAVERRAPRADHEGLPCASTGGPTTHSR
jgi:hypothetical protein